MDSSLSKSNKLHQNSTKYAAEFYAAAELFRRGFKVGLTLGNTEDIDLFAEKNGVPFRIQVKGIQAKASICWNISRYRLKEGIVFVLVNVHADTFAAPDFYILTNEEIDEKLKRVASERDYVDITQVHNEYFLNRWDKIK